MTGHGRRRASETETVEQLRSTRDELSGSIDGLRRDLVGLQERHDALRPAEDSLSSASFANSRLTRDIEATRAQAEAIARMDQDQLSERLDGLASENAALATGNAALRNSVSDAVPVVSDADIRIARRKVFAKVGMIAVAVVGTVSLSLAAVGVHTEFFRTKVVSGTEPATFVTLPESELVNITSGVTKKTIFGLKYTGNASVETAPSVPLPCTQSAETLYPTGEIACNGLTVSFDSVTLTNNGSGLLYANISLKYNSKLLAIAAVPQGGTYTYFKGGNSYDITVSQIADGVYADQKWAKIKVVETAALQEQADITVLELPTHGGRYYLQYDIAKLPSAENILPVTKGAAKGYEISIVGHSKNGVEVLVQSETLVKEAEGQAGTKLRPGAELILGILLDSSAATVLIQLKRREMEERLGRAI